MAVSFKGAHFPKEIILMGVRWYVAYPLSYRHIEELMEERGVEVDHSTIQRWVVKYSPPLEEAFHRRKRPVWVSWRIEIMWKSRVARHVFFSGHLSVRSYAVDSERDGKMLPVTEAH